MQTTFENEVPSPNPQAGDEFAASTNIHPVTQKSRQKKNPGRKNWSKTEAYSMFDRQSGDKSRILIHGESDIEFDQTALPGQAKLVIKRSEKHQRRRTNFEALDRESSMFDHETSAEEEEIRPPNRQNRLSDVISSFEDDRRNPDCVWSQLDSISKLLDSWTNSDKSSDNSLENLETGLLSLMESCSCPGIVQDCCRLLERIAMFQTKK